MAKRIKLWGFECFRCGYKWVPRSDKAPKVCPNKKCKSLVWHIPRAKDRKKAIDLLARKIIQKL
jgi:predicted Zn-ribbon and HTH transcriptional regulator